LFREPRKNHIKKNRKVNRQRREGIPTHFCLEKLSFGVLLCGILTPLTIDIVEKERKNVKLFWNYCDTYRRRIYLSLLIPLMAIASFLPEGWMEFKYKYYIVIQNDFSVKKWVR
jgi:hypothetical protein